MKLNKNKRVCEHHFRQEDIMPSGRLKFNAVPQCYIPPDVSAGASRLSPCVIANTANTPMIASSAKTPPRPPPPAATPTEADHTPPIKRPRLQILSPSPVLLRQATTPRKYSRSSLSTPLISPPGFSSPTVTTPSSTFWISNASPNQSQSSSPNPHRQTTTNPINRKLFSKSPREERPREIEVLSKKLAVKRATISRLKRDLLKTKKGLKKSSGFHNIPLKSKEGSVLINMQFHKTRQPWKKEEKLFATSLYLRSPSCYKYLTKSLILPGISTIRSWISSKECFKPGFNNHILQQIKCKASSMEDMEKACVLMFDEMAVKQALEYCANFDLIEGYEDIGTLGRQPQIGKQACVFMVRGLYYQWKLPVGYFITRNGLTGEQTKSLVIECVKCITNAGLNVKALVCDQNSTNRTAYNSLGVTVNEPWFKHEDKKIHALYDVPHLMKSVRNNLLTHDFLFDGKVVSLCDIAELVKIDSTSGSTRAAPKLTPAHIKPNSFQKMNVALATQLMSHTTASALRTVVGTGQLVTNTALNTAEFLDFMNTLFDVLNSRVMKSKNPDNCALSNDNSHSIKIMNKALKTFTSLEKLGCKSPKPPCFRGMLLTVNSMLSLLNQEEPHYLLTSRLNQDTLENLFSSIRQRGGWNKNPTVRVFRSSLRLYCLKYLIDPPKTTSYDPDYDNILEIGVTGTANDLPVQELEGTPTEDLDVTPSSDSGEEINADDPIPYDPLIPETISLETCSQQYYAGYLALMCYKKFRCEKCLTRHCDVNSTLDSVSELLILHKTFVNVNIDDPSSGLKAPTPMLMIIVSRALSVYKRYFNKIAHKQKIVARLMKITKRCLPNVSVPRDNECEEHDTYLLHTLFRVLLYKQCKWTTAALKTASMDKLRILHHV